MNLVYKNEKPLFVIAALISSIVWLAFILGTFGLALIYLLLFYLFFLFAHSAFISYLRGVGVKISKDQFPDLYERLVKSCQVIGLTKIPDAYVLRTDFFNALATRFLGRNYLVLFSDVIDAFEERPDALDFYIGHELGHIHRKHLLWAPFVFPATLLPLLGFALRRAEEYTCDRYGAACCHTEEDIKFALAGLAAGDTRWKQTNLTAYIHQVKDTSGFWMSFNEFTSDYPWLTKRAAAAIAFKRSVNVKQPSRSFLAGFLALFIPRLGIGGGLVSVMIVVAIIGILAAVALPAYQDYTLRSKNMAAYQVALQVQQEVDAYIQQNESFPGSLSDLGYTSEIVSSGQHQFEARIFDEGVIGIKVGSSNLGEEQYILLTPNQDEYGTTWQCSGENIKAATLPAACR